MKLGYDDRIHGPLEKCLEDYRPIDHGGDLPEHRIWYIRSDLNILWDKLGRIDRLFGSGEVDAPISSLTYQHIEEAKVNMKRRAEEKATRRAEKEKLRARKARQRALRATLAKDLNSPVLFHQTNSAQPRFQFRPIPTYSFRERQWRSSQETSSENLVGNYEEVKLITWNVLFDVYQIEDSNECWTHLIAEIMQCNADIIALQEVTPRFLSLVAGIEKIQSDYSLSATPENHQTVNPHGHLTTWRTSRVQCNEMYECVDGERSRALVSDRPRNCQHPPTVK